MGKQKRSENSTISEDEINFENLEVEDVCTDNIQQFFKTFNNSSGLKSSVLEVEDDADDILFKEHISEHDEIWVMQCPSQVNPSSFLGKHLNLNINDGDIQKIRVKDEYNKKKKYVAFAFNNEQEQINCILPSTEKKSAKISTLSVTGRIILQEDIRMKNFTASGELLENSQNENSMNESVLSEFTDSKPMKRERKTYIDESLTESGILHKKKKRKLNSRLVDE